MRFVVLVLLAACSGGQAYPWGGYTDPCEGESTVLSSSEVSELGFSADEAVAWYGDEAILDVTWVGRHSRTPATDAIVVTLGGIEGEIVQTLATPARADVTEDFCARMDVVAFTRLASFATEDGEVSGDGTVRFELADTSFDGARITGHAPDVTLSDARWIEVEKVVNDHLSPPDRIYLTVGRDRDTGDRAAIGVNSPNYLVDVWKCDEQIKGECADWR